ncbi:MAG: hypothetical protein KME06_03775 [Kastovskya adunca ATA6-11-RM4]|jgi:hypothetical protein|nr:hypothetical protein [Kastovskya adunca ATA6-11-RM4]
MRFSTYKGINEASHLELAKYQRELLSKTRQLILRPFVKLWQFSRYYGRYIVRHR